MKYTLTVKCVLLKDIIVEADNDDDAIQQAIESDEIFDTDDIETEVVSIGRSK